MADDGDQVVLGLFDGGELAVELFEVCVGFDLFVLAGLEVGDEAGGEHLDVEVDAGGVGWGEGELEAIDGLLDTVCEVGAIGSNPL